MSVPTAAQSWQQRELGIERAGDHAGDEWKRRAVGYVREFAARSSAPFLAEQVREFAETRGFDAPADCRAWGAVMQRAQRERIVQAHAYAPARSSNGSVKVLWRALP